MALSSPVRVLVIDDNPAIRSDVELVVQQQPGFMVAGACGTIKDALQLITTTQPDLLLLDINLTDGTGFDILEQIGQLPFKVIFLTAYNQHAIRAIKWGALDYLLKPLDENELEEALDKVLKSQGIARRQVEVAHRQFNNSKADHCIVIPSQQYIYYIDVTQIMYCSSENGYTVIHLANGEKITSSRYMKEYEEMLPARQFIRPHQSYLVNRQHLARYRRADYRKGILLMRDGTEIPVATRKKDAIQEILKTKI